MLGVAFLVCVGQSPVPTVAGGEWESGLSDLQATTYPPSILRQEVRLRKLHLVRPDLIQFPVAFEIYC